MKPQELIDIWNEYRAADKQYSDELASGDGLKDETLKRRNDAVTAIFYDLDVEAALQTLIPIAEAAQTLIKGDVATFAPYGMNRLAVSEKLLHKLEDALEGLNE